MGVILYALLTGRLPFDDENLHILLAKVKEGKYEIPQFLDEDVRDLISKMLTLNPSARINIKGVKKHPWWKKMEKKQMMMVQQSLHHTSSSEEISQQDAIQQKILETRKDLETGSSSHHDTIDVNATITQTMSNEAGESHPQGDDQDAETPKKEDDYSVQYKEEEIDPEVFQSTLEKTGLSEQALKEALMSPE